MNYRNYLKKLYRWEKGRQKTGYDKMLLGGFLWPIPVDVYLLKFSEGQEIPPHTDAVNNGKHFRLNLVLKSAKQGGEFKCEAPIFETNRIKLFRPDKSEHSVTQVVKGQRYLLSIGWVIGA